MLESVLSNVWEYRRVNRALIYSNSNILEHTHTTDTPDQRIQVEVCNVSSGNPSNIRHVIFDWNSWSGTIKTCRRKKMSLSRQNSLPHLENFDRVKEWWHHHHLNHLQNRLRCINSSSQIIPANHTSKMFLSIRTEPVDGSFTNWAHYARLERWIVLLSNWHGEKNFRVICEMLWQQLLRRKHVPGDGWWNDDVMTSLNRMLSG